MSKLKEKYLARFDQLIAEGEEIKKTEYTTGGSENRGGMRIISPVKNYVNSAAYFPWRTKVISLLQNVITKNNQHNEMLRMFNNLNNEYSGYILILNFLKGIRDDYEHGFLDDLTSQIEAEISCDYMDQAGTLMSGDNTENSYIPAAVLAGAVLEKSLRSLCERQEPSIETTKSNGQNKTMTPLIEDLKKTGVFNQAKARQLQAWADIRNAAAHGEFDKFNKNDVENMISGINNFLADYVG